MLKNDDNKSWHWLIMRILKAVMKTITRNVYGVAYYAPVTVSDMVSHLVLLSTL